MISVDMLVISIVERCFRFGRNYFISLKKLNYCRGDVGSLTRAGSMTTVYFSPPSKHVFLWFWQ